MVEKGDSDTNPWSCTRLSNLDLSTIVSLSLVQDNAGKTTLLYRLKV